MDQYPFSLQQGVEGKYSDLSISQAHIRLGTCITILCFL